MYKTDIVYIAIVILSIGSIYINIKTILFDEEGRARGVVFLILNIIILIIYFYLNKIVRKM